MFSDIEARAQTMCLKNYTQWNLNRELPLELPNALTAKTYGHSLFSYLIILLVKLYGLRWTK